MITVVLVEDRSAVLRGLRESLARDPGVRVVGEATSLERGLTLAARLTPDIVVLDAEMTGLDASSAIPAVSQRVPASALLVLTIEPDRMVGLDTIHVVGKVEGADALLDTIRATARRHSDGGDRHLHPHHRARARRAVNTERAADRLRSLLH